MFKDTAQQDSEGKRVIFQVNKVTLVGPLLATDHEIIAHRIEGKFGSQATVQRPTRNSLAKSVCRKEPRKTSTKKRERKQYFRIPFRRPLFR